ncbi:MULTISPECIES: hypothetical protein [Streptomycetaceae]|uniref:hypothetical protein n=1 Tax=Streptomycetaceae TaxID=2062 RepID=UPI0012FF7685|nr:MULTISPECIES: hypothetical protein [Streptomycetaceae]MYS61633.1 hypothetical protein [Streptomyces sp. SID5468]
MAEDQLRRLLQNAFPLVKVVEGQVLIRQPPFPRAHGVLPHQDAAVSTELIDGLVLDGLRYGRSRACAGDGP